MNLSTKIALLELRLERLQTRDRENAGVCRKIRRELRNLRAAAADQAGSPPSMSE